MFSVNTGMLHCVQHDIFDVFTPFTAPVVTISTGKEELSLLRRSIRILMLMGFFLAASGFSQSRSVAVIAHRGAHIHYPENTIPAFEAAIRMGADFIECDVRSTSDGKLVIMHNATVNATTNGAGTVRQMTFEQVRALDAGVKFGAQFAATKIPTFDEVLDLARGRIGVYVDAKDMQPAFTSALVGALKRHGMVSDAVVYGYSVAFFQEVARLDPQIRLMPEAVNQSMLQKTIQLFQPRVIAFSDFDFKAPLISLARQANAKIYVDRLGLRIIPRVGRQRSISTQTEFRPITL